MTSYTRPDWKFLLKGVGYGAVSPYQRLQPDRSLCMRPAGAPATSPPVLSTTSTRARQGIRPSPASGPYAQTSVSW